MMDMIMGYDDGSEALDGPCGPRLLTRGGRKAAEYFVYMKRKISKKGYAWKRSPHLKVIRQSEKN